MAVVPALASIDPEAAPRRGDAPCTALRRRVGVAFVEQNATLHLGVVVPARWIALASLIRILILAIVVQPGSEGFGASSRATCR